jgi:hypothetical protein
VSGSSAMAPAVPAASSIHATAISRTAITESLPR